MSRSARLVLAAVVYAMIVGLVFAALWARDGSDDYAGWSPTMAGLALPAWLVIAIGKDRLGPGGALALGLPAGLCLGGVTMLLFLPVYKFYSYDDLTALIAMTILGPVAALVMATILCRRLIGQPIRVGARRVVTIVAASGAAALLAGSVVWWGFWDMEAFPATFPVLCFLLGALPLGWSLGPALALLATRE